MVKIKPTVSGKGATTGFYDGPPPVPGTYVGKVKKMGLAKIGSGDNAGLNRIALLLEITQGPYTGAAVVHSLNETDQGKGYINQFLHAITDGSKKQCDMIEDWYWDLGYDVEAEVDGKMGQPFNYIGKPAFKPIGKKVAFVTKMDNGKAAIVNFVVPVAGSGAEEETVVEEVLEETVVEEPTVEEAVEPELVSVASDSSDADDPWGES